MDSVIADPIWLFIYWEGRLFTPTVCYLRKVLIKSCLKPFIVFVHLETKQWGPYLNAHGIPVVTSDLLVKRK